MEAKPEPLTNSQIEDIAHAAGYKAKPPRGKDMYYTFWQGDTCFLICTPNWIRQRATADTLVSLLKAERAKPRFYE